MQMFGDGFLDFPESLLDRFTPLNDLLIEEHGPGALRKVFDI